MQTSCKESGVQGGKVDVAFTGISSIDVISPTSIKVKWAKDSKYIEYRVYQKGSSEPVGKSSFSEFIVNNLIPDSNYEFSVSGVQLNSTAGEDFQQEFIGTKTYETFKGLSLGTSVLQSSSRVDLNWINSGPNIKYDILYKNSTEENFTLFQEVGPFKSKTEISESVTGLIGGVQYCFQVRAKYEDSTTAPSDEKQVSDCLITPTGLANLPTIYTGAQSPGQFPWFNALGGNPEYTIDIFEEGGGSLLPFASTNVGSGKFRSSTKLSPGKRNIYAIVKNPVTGIQGRVDLTYPPDGQQELNVRAFFTEGENAGITPPLINGGKGVQNLGQSIVSGDFNCDGLKDVAVGLPSASPVENEDLIYGTGAAIVYYNYDPPFDNVLGVDPPPYLVTEATPAIDSVYPQPHLIHYPLGTGSGLGRRLTVGNFNGDCIYKDGANIVNESCDSLYTTYTDISDREKIYSCDDLVVAGNELSEALFAIFGDPTHGLVSGSGGNNFGIDEYTCDSSSSSCRSVKLNILDPDLLRFPLALSTGDFNNDGFDDLVIAALFRGSPDNEERVFVLRGASQGLTSISHSSSFANIDINVASSTLFNIRPQANEEFGYSLAPFYNSRDCLKTNTSFQYRPYGPDVGDGIDHSKCDDLIVGAPFTDTGLGNTGAIYSCKAVLPNLSGSPSDPGQIINWDCVQHYPTELLDDTARYGHSLLGVRNQNGYPLDKLNITDGGDPGVAGALFVGAPTKTENSVAGAGAVYGYYLSPDASLAQTDHNTGGVQGLLGTASHAIGAKNMVACDARNRSCVFQKLTNSPAQFGSQFGYSLSTIDDIEDLSRGMPYLAVSAPYRDLESSNGLKTIVDSGALYLFSPDTSTFGSDLTHAPVGVVSNTFRGDSSPSCTDQCTWYSGGVSPFGAVVVYPQDLTDSSHFSIAGAVGGDFNGDLFGDLIASAPGYALPIKDNGVVYGFNSNSGSFSSIENEIDFAVDINISKELNYRFENAKVVGDINGDGYDDILSKIEIGGEVLPVLYYGSTSGLIDGVEPSTEPIGLNPRIISNPDDETMGMRFYKVGSLNCDPFDDLLLVGSSGAYIYYGSSTGIVASAAPTPSPVSKNPLIFGFGVGVNQTLVRVNSATIYGTSSGELSYDSSNQAVGHGDFNGDSCSDIAIGLSRNTSVSGLSPGDQAAIGVDGADYSSSNEGRVLVLYGSIAGLQIKNPDGKIIVEDGGAIGNVRGANPCSSGDCYPQLIPSPRPLISGGTNGDSFGIDVVGMTSMGQSVGDLTSELIVSDANYGDGEVYLYQGTAFGLELSHIQRLVPDSVNHPGLSFGLHLADVGDLNDDSFPDLLIAAPGNNNDGGVVYAFYGGPVSSPQTSLGFVGETTFNTGSFWGGGSLTLNSRFSASTAISPQIFRSINVSDSDMFGSGLVGADDFNGDGYNDVAVNVALADFSQDVDHTDSGSVIIYFGSETGLQVDLEESVSPECTYEGSSSICAPYQIFMPDLKSNDRSYLSNQAFGDINGDDLMDFIMGSRGRHHPSGDASATGVFYILY